MTEPEAGPARSRTRWTGALRFAVSVGLLVLLITKIDFADLVPEHRSLPGTLTFLILGIGLMALSIVVAAWRWQQVLAVFDCSVPVRRLTSHYFAGQFVGNVLPSTIGGDVLRVTRVSKDVGARDTAFAAVLMERLTGFVSLPLVMIIGLIVQPSLATTTNGWIAIVAGVGTIVMFGLVLVVAGHPNLAGRFTEHQNWTRYIGMVHIGVTRLRRHPRQAVGVLGTACLYQFIVVGGVYCAVHTIGLTIPNAAVLAFVPAVAIAQVLPLSVGGFGLREGLLVLLLHPLGVETGQAVAVGLLWYAMVLIASLAGAPAFAIGHRARGSTRVVARRDRRGFRAADQHGRAAPAAAAPAPPRRPAAERRRRPLLVGGGRVRRHLLRDLHRGPEPQRGQRRRRCASTPGGSSTAQRIVGINVEQQIQHWALGFRPLIIACNYFYGSLHFVVTAGVLVYLYHRWRDDYPRWRNTIAIATALALVGFVLFPLMPPRLLPSSYGFVDTLAKDPAFWSFNSGAFNKISNQFAAMPSVHCAWALWCACALVPRLKHVWAKVLAACYPVFTVTAIVLTANHYFLDAVGGFVALGIGYVVARAATRAGRLPVHDST